MRVAVYCGSSSGGDPRFMATAATIGTELARRGIGLVYGGGGDGCMGAVADAALGGGGEAIGVIPRALVDTESAHVGLTRLEIVASMHERKARMVALADGFLALPGGFGTLDELFETITWFALGIHRKPITVLDVAGYYRPLRAFCDAARAMEFVGPTIRDHLTFGDEPSATLAALAARIERTAVSVASPEHVELS